MPSIFGWILIVLASVWSFIAFLEIIKEVRSNAKKIFAMIMFVFFLAFIWLLAVRFL